MPTHSEVERLQKVYRSYHGSQVIQAQWSEANPGNQAILRERTRALGQSLHGAGFLPLAPYRVLDVGCGSGQVLASLQQWHAEPGNLYGVDLLRDRVEVAQQRFPEIHFQQSNAERLDFSDEFFDLVLLFTVFTSILDASMAANVAREVDRVLRPGGAIVWYDFRYNNPRNPNVRGLDRRMIADLFRGFELRLRTLTLLPPLARRLGPSTPVLYPVLATVPLLRTHYLGLLIKPEPDAT